MKRNWFSCKRATGQASTGEISIYDEIGFFGVTVRDFAAALKALGPVRQLNIHINSPGGDVTDGFAIYNLLNRHPAQKTVYIDGMAASMASVIAMAGDRRIMPENAWVMIHNPVGGVVGEGPELRSFADVLDRMKDQIAGVYADHTLLTLAEISRLMDAETWLDASQALAKGFADEIEEPIQIAAKFDLSRFTKVPKGATMPKNPARTEAENLEAELSAEDRAEIGAAAVASDRKRTANITAMCKLAGFPDKAADFAKGDKSESDILAELDKARDEADKKNPKNKRGVTDNEISARHTPGDRGENGGGDKINTTEIYAKWNTRQRQKVAA